MTLFDSASHRLSFSPLNCEQCVRLPYGNQMLDTWIAMEVQPPDSHPGNIFAIPSDLKVYIEGSEVTSHIIDAIQDELDGVDSGSYRDKYKECLDLWLVLVEKMGSDYPYDHDKTRDSAAQMAGVAKLSDLVRSLGDRTSYPGGLLHPLRFMFSSMGVPPISLGDVLESAGLDRELMNGGLMVLSCGPSRLYDESWSPPSQIPSGSLQISLRAEYKDPLADRVRDLELLLERVHGDIKAARRSLAMNGPIQRKVGSLLRSASETEKAAKEANHKLAQLDAESGVVTGLLLDLKTTIQNNG